VCCGSVSDLVLYQTLFFLVLNAKTEHCQFP
jgi:hypothetical protein